MGWPRMVNERTLLWTDSTGRPITVTEVTIRTLLGRMLLTPTARNCRRIMGVFARAMELYDFELYCVACMGNHMSYVMGFRSPAHLAEVMQHVHGNVARELGWFGDYSTTKRRLFRWMSRFWSRRGKPISAMTEADAVQRLKYALSNGPKEGIARTPQGMGGAHSGRALCTTERVMVGERVDRTKLAALRRELGNVSELDATTVYEIKLSKLPFLRHLSDEEYRDFCAGICDDITQEAREQFGPGYKPKNLHQRRKVDPLTTVELASSPAPLVHCSDPDLYDEYVAVYRAFVEAYQLAHAELKRCLAEGLPITVRFPEGGNMPVMRATG